MAINVSLSVAQKIISTLRSIVGIMVGDGNVSGTPASQSSTVSTLIALVSPSWQYVDMTLVNGTATSLQLAHGLGRTPVSFRSVLHCVTNDASSGITVGQEFNSGLCQDSANTASDFLEGYDSTYIYASYSGHNGALPHYPVGSNQFNTLSSYSNFVLRVYYR